MNKITYAATIDDGPAFTTDDTGRLWAYVQGVLVGSGHDVAKAATATNGAVNSVVATRREQTKILNGGRLLKVWAWEESS